MRDYSGQVLQYYDLLTQGREDVDFYLAESLRRGGPVLDLGCGTGRVALPLAGAGLSVVGLDLSWDMLALARHKAQAAGPPIRERLLWLQGDMSAFCLRRRFPVILIPDRGFCHLLTSQAQAAALAAVRHHLAPRGACLFNVPDPHPQALAQAQEPGRARPRQVALVPLPGGAGSLRLDEGRSYDPATRVMTHHLVFEEVDGGGRPGRSWRVETSLRLTPVEEMQALLEAGGLAVRHLYGDFRRGPFRPGGEQIWVVERRERSDAPEAAGDRVNAPT